jgi:hypothetical protein
MSAPEQLTVSLGFTDEEVPVGTHICQIYSDADERNDSLLQYLLSGLKARERTACFSDRVTDETLHAFFAEHGLSLSENVERGSFSLAGTLETYFPGGRFDPDAMLERLADFSRVSIAEGYKAARAIGEMNPDVQTIPGGSRLLEYESRVTVLLRDHPVTTVCQYSGHDFTGAMIMDILKVHPRMLVRGAVVENPFYIPPEEFLSE